MSQTSNASVQTPWDDLEYPLSVLDLKRLDWLKWKIGAKEALGAQQKRVSGREASRLGFVAWLVFTHRLNDWNVA